MTMRIRFDGIDQLKEALNPEATLEKVRHIVKTNGAELQAQAIRNAPYKTGNLMRSIGMQIKNGGKTAEVEAQAEYAPYLEYGTRFMEAQPYMKPAFNKQKVKFENDLANLDK